MDFFKVLENRHSIRNYLSRPVERTKLERILAAAASAPSACNLQSYDIFIVTKVKQRSALAKAACGQGFVLVAPVVLVFCTNSRNAERFGARARNFYALQDATIACSYAQLAATAQGLGSCWVGAFEPDEVRAVLGVGKEHEPVAILPIGYISGKPEIKEHLPPSELTHTL